MHRPASRNGGQAWGFAGLEELEFLNLSFLICFVHPARLALVVIIFLFKFEEKV